MQKIVLKKRPFEKQTDQDLAKSLLQALKVPLISGQPKVQRPSLPAATEAPIISADTNELLRKRIVSSSDYTDRMEALKELEASTGKSVSDLKILAIYSQSKAVRLAAVDAIDLEHSLVDIAKFSDYEDARIRAFEKISPTGWSLMSIIKEGMHNDVKMRAVASPVMIEGLLVKVVEEAEREVSEEAMARLEKTVAWLRSPRAIKMVAVSAKNEMSGRKAVEMLESMIDATVDKATFIIVAMYSNKKEKVLQSLEALREDKDALDIVERNMTNREFAGLVKNYHSRAL
ncbi:MAG: hypothetical protein MN733_09685 [Nitrososphaera sp.]|nr:hypothetical protein [Nitrososphaera sp.]